MAILYNAPIGTSGDSAGWDGGTTCAKLEKWIADFAADEFSAMNEIVVACLQENDIEKQTLQASQATSLRNSQPGARFRKSYGSDGGHIASLRIRACSRDINMEAQGGSKRHRHWGS